MTQTAASKDTNRMVRQEMILGQLRPVEGIIDAARKEVARLRSSAKAAQEAGRADPAMLAEAEQAATGVEELIQRFEAMQDELSGHSQAADAAMADMHRALEALQRQIDAVVKVLTPLA